VRALAISSRVGWPAVQRPLPVRRAARSASGLAAGSGCPCPAGPATASGIASRGGPACCSVPRRRPRRGPRAGPGSAPRACRRGGHSSVGPLAGPGGTRHRHSRPLRPLPVAPHRQGSVASVPPSLRLRLPSQCPCQCQCCVCGKCSKRQWRLAASAATPPRLRFSRSVSLRTLAGCSGDPHKRKTDTRAADKP
jgi:hypothetical protein